MSKMRKEKFISTATDNIERPGIKNLLAWLETTDFYTAPASTKYHGYKNGGLLEHSIQVYDNLRKLADFYMERNVIGYISAESIAIVGLFHDLCKVNTYHETWEGGGWYRDEKFKFGTHGGKSVYLIMQHLVLTPEEAAAINCHMGAYDNKDVSRVYEINSLAWLLHVADEEAAFVQKV